MTESTAINVAALRRDGEMLYSRQLFSDLKGETFLLNYSLTACEQGLCKDDSALTVYGIRVDKYSTDSENTLVDTACTPHVTTSPDIACELIDTLIRNGVTPISLKDVVSDILLERACLFK